MGLLWTELQPNSSGRALRFQSHGGLSKQTLGE